MAVDFLLTDDLTPATALTFGPTAAGDTSAAQILHLWHDQDTPGAAITNLSVQAVGAVSGLDAGEDWLDETWLEARVNGGTNPSADVTFISYTSDWFRIGVGSVLPIAHDLPGDCAYYIEVRLHPPLKDGTATETVDFKLIANYSESALALGGALSDLGQGIVTGIGDLTLSEWIEAPATTETGTPDDEIHVSAPRMYLYNGAPFTTTTLDDLTLNQTDGDSAALTSGHEYKAVISQPPGVELAAVVTKGSAGLTGAGVVPALPEGNLLIAVVNVAYNAVASVIAQADITEYAVDGWGKPSFTTGLTVHVGAIRAILPGARIINRSARDVTVPLSDTSWIWLGSSDAFEVSDSATPPFAGALPICSAVADATDVTSVTDLRVFFGIDASKVGVNTTTFTSGTGVAVNVADVSVPSGSSTSGEISFEIELSDGTDFAVLRGRFAYAATNKAGTLAVSGAPTIYGSENAESAGGGAISATATVTTGTNEIHLNVVPAWTVFTPTTKNIHWRHDSTQTNAVTAL